MICDICERPNVENVGIKCEKYKVCLICINKLIEDHMILNNSKVEPISELMKKVSKDKANRESWSED